METACAAGLFILSGSWRIDVDKLIELHLHLDGSLRPETVWELAKEQNIKLPANTVDEVRDQMQVPEDCRTLEEYLTRFDLPLLVLQTREALERATFELTEDLAKEGVTYAEIRFAPQLSIKGGMTQEQAVEAAIEGVKRGMEQYPSIRVGLILCCMRGEDNEEWNLQTVETAKKYLGDVVCAVDIAGAESLYPTERFAPVFEKVREYGLPSTIHAGEAAGPESMKTALAFGAKRIGHGVAAVEDPELVRRLIEEQITLESHPPLVQRRRSGNGQFGQSNGFQHKRPQGTGYSKECIRIQGAGDRENGGIRLGGQIPSLEILLKHGGKCYNSDRGLAAIFQRWENDR